MSRGYSKRSTYKNVDGGMMNKNITDEYWMKMVRQLAEASTCRVKVGCIILQKNLVIGMGYVGSISGDYHCNELVDEGIEHDSGNGCLLVDNRGKKGSSDFGKSCIRTIHAEMNAVLKTTVRGTKDNWLSCYCSYTPCLECMKLLLQIGVRKIIWEQFYRDEDRDYYIEDLSDDIKDELIIEKYEKDSD